MVEFVDSQYNMQDPSNVFLKTLNQIYDESLDVGNRSQIFIYNDHGQTDTYGHMKGVVAFDPVEQNGFWLTHSVPNFPPTPASQETLVSSDLTYPSSGRVNAQHLMCLSIDEENFLTLADALYKDRPGYHYIHISEEYRQKSEVLANIYKNKEDKQDYLWRSQPVNGSYTLQTINKMNFTVFYKNQWWNQDLWSDMIQPQLGQPMYVNTWLQSGMNNTEFVQKICQIEACVETCQEWASTKDHSKIGVTDNGEYTCFSDINFDQSQAQRGGGATCIRDLNIGQEMLRRAKEIRNDGLERC